MNQKKPFRYPTRKAAPAAEKITPRMLELAAKAYENQLKANDPPCTKETLQRLTDSGVPARIAREKIIRVLAEHMYSVMHDKHRFNENRYALDLSKLK